MSVIKPEPIEVNGLQVEVIRTSRIKTASIKIEDGLVSIVVPKALDIERVHQLVAERRQWIIQKIALHDSSLPASTREFVSGEAYAYLGRNYRLKVVCGDYVPVKLYQGRLVATLPDGAKRSNLVRDAVIRWYKLNALRKIKEKVRRYSKVMGLEPKSVDIKTFKSRWGSCSPKGELDFNWIIVMAPNRVVDYVVIHELCHLKLLDHSPKFWKEVERVMPDYAEHKEWLKVNSGRLVV
ncbi:M48 family metallopeptidase [Shewanella electrodiphila]|uniref:M48 family metallopeptidase n=1 Tax=Shewanella electrodiphila TaxID=934143 RepID=A0ABT0KUJ4_9GAMM|nr:SprT family zinc-dependent metalloprotease [Shewanella electrodiphila]MCL1047515.1 M48 family metallopeptidase [Shewanella electrodiphila]